MNGIDPPTLVRTEAGVFAWPGYALVERRGSQFVRASEREISHLVGSLCGASAIYGPLMPTLDRAVRLLECGQVEKAKTCVAGLRLPPRSPAIEKIYLRGAHDRRPPFAKVFNPDLHPRWPAGQSDGGQFRPTDGGPAIPVSDPEKLPTDRPPTPAELNRLLRQRSAILRQEIIGGRLSRAEAIAELVATVGPELLDEAHALYSRFISRFDRPMSLDDLITRTYSESPPSWPAYEEHHIVEAGPNEGLIPDSLLQSRRNRVKIPYYIHRDISDFYSTKNATLGNQAPRDFLRGKNFDEQYQYGLEILRKYGVLQ